MKHENRESANNICDRIDQLTGALESMNSKDLTVAVFISSTYPVSFLKFSAAQNTDDFSPFAIEMAEKIRQNITNRIENLKLQLDLL